MYQPINYSLLVEKKACPDQLDLVAKHFGKTKAIPLTKAVVAKFSSVFDINWASRNLLTKEDLAEFKKVNILVWEEYERVIALAYAEYEKVTALEFVRLYKKGMKKTT